MTTTAVDKTTEPSAEEQVLALVPTLGPLQLRYFAMRLTQPEIDPAEILTKLKMPQEAKVRWRFPAEMEAVLDVVGTVPGLAREIGVQLLEMYIPEAAATLVALMGSADEKIALRAAERLLEGKTVLKRSGTTINVGGDHRRIDLRAIEMWNREHPSD